MSLQVPCGFLGGVVSFVLSQHQNLFVHLPFPLAGNKVVSSQLLKRWGATLFPPETNFFQFSVGMKILVTKGPGHTTGTFTHSHLRLSLNTKYNSVTETSCQCPLQFWLVLLIALDLSSPDQYNPRSVQYESLWGSKALRWTKVLPSLHVCWKITVGFSPTPCTSGFDKWSGKIRGHYYVEYTWNIKLLSPTGFNKNF